MNIEAKITVNTKKPELLLKCFKPETFKKQRCLFTIKKHKNKIVFDVKAKDAVAFRAVQNSISQLLILYEKVSKIK